MARTFAERLKHFAMSGDFVDTDLCRSIRNLVDRYVTETLGMDFYHVMVDGTRIKGRPALKTAVSSGQAWSNENQDTVPVHEHSGDYKGQSTFAYEMDKKIWVTSALDDGKNVCLNDTVKYQDHWSDVTDLPKYFSDQKPEVRTSIVVPLRYGDRVFGFICLEGNQLLEFTESGKRETEALADAIAIVIWLYEGYLKQQESRKSAFSEIESIVNRRRILSPLSKPKVFFATSSRADREVVGAIRETVSELEPYIQEVFWREIKEPGDITAQVMDELGQCRFGICYLSEPSEDVATADHDYIDNPNVLFEAGMLQSLSRFATEGPDAWIPVRESASPPAPFDIGHERSVVVARLNNGSFNTDSFRAELKGHLEAILGTRSGK
jgi:hypothetical protein